MIQQLLFSILLIAVYSSARQVGRINDALPNTDACKNSRRCARLANLLIKRRNNSVDPCDNFYNYACGNNDSVEPLAIRDSKSRILKEIREILEKQPERRKSKSLSVERQLFKVCSNSGPSLGEEKYKFLALLQSTGGLRAIATKPVPEFSMSWQEADKLYTKLGSRSAFFDIKRTEIETESGTKNILTITPPMWKRKATTRISTIYLFQWNDSISMIDEVVKANPPTSNDAIPDFKSRLPFDAMLAFGEELDKIVEEVEDNIESQNSTQMTLSDWQKEYEKTQPSTDASQINWLDVMESLLSIANIDIDGSELIKIDSKEYFKKLAHVLQHTPNDVITSYVHLNFIYDFYQYATGYNSEQPLDIICLGFSDLVGTWHEFLMHHKLHANHQLANQMNTEIKNYIVNEARKNLMDHSKNENIERINQLQAVMGYPDWMHNRSVVESYYDGLDVTTSVFENLINMMQFSKKRDLMKLRNPEIPERYQGHLLFNDMTGMILENHKIVYSAEYLMRSFYGLFDAKYPRGINYGALGGEFGLFWWNFLHREDKEHYDAKYVENKKCFEKKVDANELTEEMGTMDKNSFVNSMMIGNAVQYTFKAYNSHPHKSNKGNKLPGLEDLSDQQLFFLAFANNLCATGLEDETNLLLNEVLSNMEEFSTTFKCQQSSRMNKESKCYKP